MSVAALDKAFESREALVQYVTQHFPKAAKNHPAVSEIRGGFTAAQQRLAQIQPERYARTRNALDGAVTRLSPYLRHGVLSLSAVRDVALQHASAAQAEKFVNELCWRDYWQRCYRALGDGIWEDLEPYKTGYPASSYATHLPNDIRAGQTDSDCINHMIAELYTTGYLHNRLRLYLAAYVVHWRRVRWQAGAAWFLEHLLDGDPASNHLSWQWVASSFGSKPYFFNQENMAKYLAGFCDTRQEPLFAGSYEAVAARLFPNGQGSGGADNPLKDKLRKASVMPLPKSTPLRRPVIWVHGDNLNPYSPALQAYPDAAAVWVWDDTLLERYNITLKRLVFLYECLLELPADIQRGDVAEQVLAFAQRHHADGIITMDSPSPRFWGIVSSLRAHLPVSILQDVPITDTPASFDLRRFSRYWEKARGFAFG